MLRGNEFGDDIYEISGAPDVGSLAELLDDPENAYAYNINKPHIRVKTRNLVNVMTVSRKISEQSGRDLISKTIGIKASPGKLQLFLTNQDEYAELSLELDNNIENLLEDFIPISFNHLFAIIHSCFDYFVLYKDKGSYFVKILGGDIELDTVKDIKQGQMEKKGKYKDVGFISEDDFKMVSKCKLVAGNSISRSLRKVFIKNNEVIACYQAESTLFYKSQNKLPNINLRLKDVGVINSLIKMYELKDLKVAIKAERTKIYNNSFSYSFYRVKRDTKIKSYAGNISTIEPISIKLSELEKLVLLSTKHPNSQQRLNFNYTEDGKIQCLVLLNNFKFRALLGKDKKNKFSKLEEDIKISTTSINALVSSFDSMEVSLFLTKKGLIIRSGELRGICYGSEED